MTGSGKQIDLSRQYKRPFRDSDYRPGVKFTTSSYNDFYWTLTDDQATTGCTISLPHLHECPSAHPSVRHCRMLDGMQGFYTIDFIGYKIKRLKELCKEKT